MAERPMIFGGESVRAIFAARKTQTRRVVSFESLRPEPFGHADVEAVRLEADGFHCRAGKFNVWSRKPLSCLYGVVGDRLWIRETWCELIRPHWEESSLPKDHLSSRYGLPRRNACAYKAETTPAGEEARADYGYQWKTPLFMPRWASRLTLEVTEVRVERLQDISEADAVAEGCVPRPAAKSWGGFQRHEDGERSFVQGGAPSSGPPPDWMEHPELQTVVPPMSAREVYRCAWDSLNAKRGFSWESNPWVWAVTFRRCG